MNRKHLGVEKCALSAQVGTQNTNIRISPLPLVSILTFGYDFSLFLELRFPPYVFLETEEYVRIVGEELKIPCTTHNPNFYYNVTWKYTTKSVSTRYFYVLQ